MFDKRPRSPSPTSFTEVKKRTGFFESFDGTKIYYEVRGEGKPIFLCYGIACLINHWTHQIRAFSNDYQTIVFDYRGHHQSETPRDPEELTIDAICKDIQGLAQHLGIEKASFWGHSYGVQILLRLYELSPELISNMVFINGFATNPMKGMFGGFFSDMFGVDLITPLLQLFKDGNRFYPGPLSAIWKAAITNPIAIPLSSLAGGFNLGLTSLKDIEVYARGVASMDLDVFIRLFEQMMNYDAEHVLPTIKIPVLIISGNKDGVTPASYQEQMHERIKGSQLTRVPYGSHCTQLDLPDFVNLRIEKFLAGIAY